MNEKIAYLVAALIAAVMLFLAPQRHPYDYYVILRWVTCGTSAFGFYLSYKLQIKLTMWLLGIIAVLFNPIIPVTLSRSTWQPIDVVAGLVIISTSLVILFSKRSSVDKQSD